MRSKELKEMKGWKKEHEECQNSTSSSTENKNLGRNGEINNQITD